MMVPSTSRPIRSFVTLPLYEQRVRGHAKGGATTWVTPPVHASKRQSRSALMTEATTIARVTNPLVE
jgi:hypothetical protein